MSDWRFPFCPQPPEWKLDWAAAEAALGLGPLSAVPQNPTWHAEGNVLIHTRMVAEAMTADPQWRALPELERNILFVSGLLHDIGKGPTTRSENGQITSPRHTVVGQRLARRLLWMGVENSSPDFIVREMITGLVRYHGLPVMFLEKPNPERAVIEASQSVRCDHLALLARADVLGRICPDASDFLARIALFQELCAEQECLVQPKAFASDHHRFIYFNGNSDYSYVPYDDSRCEVTLMSGLPATGKDYWVAHHAADLPVIGLDDLRSEMDVDPADNQGGVAKAAKEQAKVHLRQEQSFVWNATNITRELRQQLIALFANYKARIRVVYVECPADELNRRNRSRPKPVPASVIERMIEKLEVPTVTEAHQLLVARQ
jgi:putative nucleotidyltransferase with HDIG domain